jgi:hypothetical protein
MLRLFLDVKKGLTTIIDQQDVDLRLPQVIALAFVFGCIGSMSNFN